MPRLQRSRSRRRDDPSQRAVARRRHSYPRRRSIPRDGTPQLSDVRRQRSRSRRCSTPCDATSQRSAGRRQRLCSRRRSTSRDRTSQRSADRHQWSHSRRHKTRQRSFGRHHQSRLRRRTPQRSLRSGSHTSCSEDIEVEAAVYDAPMLPTAGPDPMALLEENAASITNRAGEPSLLELPDAAEVLEVQQRTDGASPSMGALVTDTLGKHVNVFCEQVSVPVLVEGRASLPPSPSPEPRKAVSSSRDVESQPKLQDFSAVLDGEQEYSPLERYLLRSGEILESYSVTSRALTR